MTDKKQFKEENGILIPNQRPHYRDEEYNEKFFEMLVQMQREHFWYQGRHKLIWSVLKKEIPQHFGPETELSAIDMGGGCGGWIEYLKTHGASMFQRLALADGSIKSLSLAKPIVGSFATRYQIDLLDLSWQEEWDVVFLLDVLEHIPDHLEVLRQIRKSLRPGGLLIVTAPALQFFWTYNDNLVRHQRRYSKHHFRELSKSADLKLLRTDYFMFFLSPVLLLSRMLTRPPSIITPERIRDHMARTHRIPWQPINKTLTMILSLEARIVNHVRLPWGTSIHAIFQR